MEHEMTEHSEILLYSDENGKEFVNVVFMDETFWLTQIGMAELFDSSKFNISEHLFAVRLFTARDIRSRTFQKRMQAAHWGKQRTAAQSPPPFGRKRCDSGDRSRSHRCSA